MFCTRFNFIPFKTDSKKSGYINCCVDCSFFYEYMLLKVYFSAFVNYYSACTMSFP